MQPGTSHANPHSQQQPQQDKNNSRDHTDSSFCQAPPTHHLPSALHHAGSSCEAAHFALGMHGTDRDIVAGATGEYPESAEGIHQGPPQAGSAVMANASLPPPKPEPEPAASPVAHSPEAQHHTEAQQQQQQQSEGSQPPPSQDQSYPGYLHLHDPLISSQHSQTPPQAPHPAHYQTQGLAQQTLQSSYPQQPSIPHPSIVPIRAHPHTNPHPQAHQAHALAPMPESLQAPHARAPGSRHPHPWSLQGRDSGPQSEQELTPMEVDVIEMGMGAARGGSFAMDAMSGGTGTGTGTDMGMGVGARVECGGEEMYGEVRSGSPGIPRVPTPRPSSRRKPQKKMSAGVCSAPVSSRCIACMCTRMRCVLARGPRCVCGFLAILCLDD